MRMKGRSGISRALYVTAVEPARGDLKGFHEENGKDAAPRNRLGLVSRETDQSDGEVTDATYHRTAQEMDEGAEVPQGLRSAGGGVRPCLGRDRRSQSRGIDAG